MNYAVSSSPIGPFIKKGNILKSDGKVANGPGHNGYLKIEGTDDYLIAYHRRPLEANEPGCRVLCLDRLFVGDGNIKEVKMTEQFEI